MTIALLLLNSLLAIPTTAASAPRQTAPNPLVFVQGGTFKDTKSNFYAKRARVSSFFISKFEVTQREWVNVMASNPSDSEGDNLPVENVSWYDCIEYCNKRSLKEGLRPYYTIDKSKKDPNNKIDPVFGVDLDPNKWIVTINAGADGYRLPTEAEWEYAASGGQRSKSYTYSGSNDVGKVAWYYINAGDKPLSELWQRRLLELNHNRTHSVGSKVPNELGLYDMSGNVREWCWDWYGDLKGPGIDPKGSSGGYYHVWKGGGWVGVASSCALSFRGNSNPTNFRSSDQGFRVCRDTVKK